MPLLRSRRAVHRARYRAVRTLFAGLAFVLAMLLAVVGCAYLF